MDSALKTIIINSINKDAKLILTEDIRANACANIIKDASLSAEQKSAMIQTIMQESSLRDINQIINFEMAMYRLDDPIKNVTNMYEILQTYLLFITDAEAKKKLIAHASDQILTQSYKELSDKVAPLKKIVTDFIATQPKDAKMEQYDKDASRLIEYMVSLDKDNPDHAQLIQKLSEHHKMITTKITNHKNASLSQFNPILKRFDEIDRKCINVVHVWHLFKETKEYKEDYDACMAYLRNKRYLFKSQKPEIECSEHEQPTFIKITQDAETLCELLPLIKNGTHLLPDNIMCDKLTLWRIATVMYYLGFEFIKDDSVWWKKTDDTLPRYYVQKASNISEFTREQQ